MDRIGPTWTEYDQDGYNGPIGTKVDWIGPKYTTKIYKRNTVCSDVVKPSKFRVR